MAINVKKYQLIEVESYLQKSTSGIHGKVPIRPILGQADFDSSLHVKCSKEMSTEYPVGSCFLIKGKLNDLKVDRKFIYSSYQWPYEVISHGSGRLIKD